MMSRTCVRCKVDRNARCRDEFGARFSLFKYLLINSRTTKELANVLPQVLLKVEIAAIKFSD